MEMIMKNNSIISVTNRQSIYEDENTLEFIVMGQYFFKDDKYHIIYNEYKNKKTNELQDICSIKVENPELVIITKIGLVESRLILEKGKRHLNYYKTEHGIINMGIYTKNIECNMKEKSAKIRLKYCIDVNLDLLSENEVYIDVKGKDTEDVEYTDNDN